MVIVKKGGDGKYYLFTNRSNQRHSPHSAERNFWIARNGLVLKNHKFPDELLGKRVRFSVEVIDDPPERNKNKHGTNG